MSERKIGFIGGKFLPLHLGHVYSILYSASKCDELHVFLFTNTPNEETMISNSIFPKDLLQPDIRELILKYEFEGFGNIKIHTIDFKASFTNLNNEGWDYNSTTVIDIAGCTPDIIFSGDSSKEKHFKILYPFAEFSLVDPDRCLFNISSSKIRNEGSFKNWQYIPKSYKSLCSRSIVILGDTFFRVRLISDLCKIFNTSAVKDIHCSSEEEIRKRILEARFNSDKIFFINSVDDDNEKYIPFYNMHNYRFSINFSDEEVIKYNSKNLSGEYYKVLEQGILRIKAILAN